MRLLMPAHLLTYLVQVASSSSMYVYWEVVDSEFPRQFRDDHMIIYPHLHDTINFGWS